MTPTRCTFWTMARSHPLQAAQSARRAEEQGFDGVLFGDSQNLSGDVYVGLGAAAATTVRIGLGTGVTNPVTRHPAVTASAIASVHVLSKGRAALGIGRGDSSLAHLGLDPAPVEQFRSYVQAVRAYLRGQAVTFDEAGNPADARPLGTNMPLSDKPAASRLEWLAALGDIPPVPVFVAATGPKVIELAASSADEVMLAVGADPDRLGWGIDLARSVRPDVKVGAYVVTAVDADAQAAFELVRGVVTSFARFSVMHGKATGPTSDTQRSVLEKIPERYQMTQHFERGAQTEEIPFEFADQFAVLGSVERCIERFRELLKLGLDRIVLVGPFKGVAEQLAAESQARFAQDVLPALIEEAMT